MYFDSVHPLEASFFLFFHQDKLLPIITDTNTMLIALNSSLSLQFHQHLVGLFEQELTVTVAPVW